jgi:Ca2+/Na+ antiporter
MGHLTMVRVLDAGFGVLATGTGAYVFHLWTLPAIDGTAEFTLMTVLGALILLLVGGLGLACLLAALRLGRGRGRMLQTFLACSLLLTFPIGTIFALYALWVCWAHPDVRRHLAPREDVAPAPVAEPGLLKAAASS